MRHRKWLHCAIVHAFRHFRTAAPHHQPHYFIPALSPRLAPSYTYNKVEVAYNMQHTISRGNEFALNSPGLVSPASAHSKKQSAPDASAQAGRNKAIAIAYIRR